MAMVLNGNEQQEVHAGRPPRAGRTIPVDDLLKGMKLSPYSVLMVAVCLLVAIMEGYDVNVMALAAPLVKNAWGLKTSSLGLVLAGSVIGMVAGSLLLAPLGDRLGRKPMIVAGLLLTALATAIGAHANGIEELLVTRVFAGIGLGVALPVTLTLAMEMVPFSLRAVTIVIVMCGYPIGGLVGAWAAGELVDAYGYGGIFYLGGGAALVAGILAMAVLTESPYVLARKGPAAQRQLRIMLTRFRVPPPEDADIQPPMEKGKAKIPVAALFDNGRGIATVLLWVVCFANMLTVYFFINWLPTLFLAHGLTPQGSLRATAFYNGGGLIGAIILASVMHSIGASRTLAAAYFIALVAIPALASQGGDGPMFFAAILACGAAVGGSQKCLNAVTNQFYPSAIRSTGGGYASGAGRLGAVAAPLLGGALIGKMGSVRDTLLLAMIPPFIALVGMSVLWWLGSLRNTQDHPPA